MQLRKTQHPVWSSLSHSATSVPPKQESEKRAQLRKGSDLRIQHQHSMCCGTGTAAGVVMPLLLVAMPSNSQNPAAKLSQFTTTFNQHVDTIIDAVGLSSFSAPSN